MRPADRQKNSGKNQSFDPGRAAVRSLARLLLAILSACTLGYGQDPEADLQCFTDAEKTSANFYSQLQQDAYRLLDQRDAAFEELKTPDQIAARQRQLREFFLAQLGGFPDKTPLNARTVRTIQAEGYRIECVIFESRPNHHVTANLYLPESPQPVPGIAVSSGHSRTAKTAEYNQRFGIMMARNGMAALCYDPIGQGERSQILNEQHEPEHSGTTTEHFLVGVGSILTGRNTASYRIWDGIRAIDYLCSRPEIDPAKIGFTGCSGGGTLTSYVMALDDRVACAAPACYLTTFRRLIETIGPQDAEQNIAGQLKFGMDQPDYILMRAPRPTLISSTTQDFFDSRGSWENFRQGKRIYGRLGAPERIDLVEIEGNHGVQPQNLATIAQWMVRWLRGVDQSIPIADLATRPPEELLCLPGGQVLTLPEEKSVFDLNAEYERSLAPHRAKLAATTSPEKIRELIRSVAGIRADVDTSAPEFEDRGRIARDGYHIDKLVLKCRSGRLIPGLTWHPVTPSDEAYLYLHDGGKTAAQSNIEKIVASGFAVVSVDLSGQGETTTAKPDPLLTDWKSFFLAYLMGQSIIGVRAEDILNSGDFVAFYQKDRSQPRKVHLVAEGQTGIAALHAAALKPGLFASVTLRGTPASWVPIVGDPHASGQLESTIHGVLGYWDLPDLEALIGTDRIHREP